jgi:hypothetical protein
MATVAFCIPATILCEAIVFDEWQRNPTSKKLLFIGVYEDKIERRANLPWKGKEVKFWHAYLLEPAPVQR